MGEMPGILFAVFTGMLLGGVFFGGLWWTIRKALTSSLAALWFFGSLLLRTALVVCGFLLVSRGDWRRMVSCVVGFLCTRLLVAVLTRANPIEGAA
jgi:F1F0 ATPase subunit 2